MASMIAGMTKDTHTANSMLNKQNIIFRILVPYSALVKWMCYAFVCIFLFTFRCSKDFTHFIFESDVYSSLEMDHSFFKVKIQSPLSSYPTDI